MDSVKAITSVKEQPITIYDVNRLLELGRLLMSVLKPEEIKAIQVLLSETPTNDQIGNAGDS
jgi:hypothetical protein